METARAAPSELNYSPNQVPLAIPSEASRQEFLPSNNGTFKYGNSQTIDISINGDFFLDCSQSYLQATITNLSTTGPLCLEFGPSWIRKLEIKSAGVVLESIDQYHRLYAMLMAAQTDDVHSTQGVYCGSQHTSSVESYSKNTASAAAAETIASNAKRVAGGPRYPQPVLFNTANGDLFVDVPPSGVLQPNVPDSGTSNKYTMCIPLISALFNSSQMIPCLLSSAGLQISIELAPPSQVGVTYNNVAGADLPANDEAKTLYAETQYEISNVKYMAHCVSLDNSFTGALRQQLAESGAISMHGTAWRQFSATYRGDQSNPTINIPARMRSIKSMFVTMRNQASGSATTAAAADADGSTKVKARSSTNGRFNTSAFVQCGVSKAQFKVGSAQFPTTPINLDPYGYASWPGDLKQAAGSGTAEAYCECLKAFGKLGATDHTTSLTRLTYSQTGNAGNPGPGDWMRNFILAIDMESFGKSVLESGTDSSSRSLPIILELQRQTSVGDDEGYLHVDRTYQNLLAAGTADTVYAEKCIIANPKADYITVDTYVCSDIYFFFNSDGSIVSSV